MRRYSFILIQFVLIFFTFSCTSLVKFRSGIKSLDYLKEVRNVNVVFDYSDMSVGEYDDERDYIADKVKEKNEKHPGEGDLWEEKWYGQREHFFEPAFLERLNDFTTHEKDLYFSKNNADAKYTVVIHTLFMEPGFNIGIVSKDAEIDAEIIFFESDDLGNPLSKFDAYNIEGSNTSHGMYYSHGTYGTGMTTVGPGDLNSYSVSGRLSDAYRRCGAELAEYIDENMTR